MRFHSTREKDYFFYYRCWFYVTDKITLSMDFLLGGTSPHLSIGRGSRSIKFHLTIPYVFSIWLKAGGILPYKREGRELSIRAHSGSIWLNLWTEPWDGKTHVFHFKDFFIGKATHSETILEERDILVPMPEKAYPAHAKFFESTWTYPRWFATKIKRVSIDVPEGIPHEGKGENSWDCGRDATYGITTGPCRGIPEGVGHLVGSVLRERVKNGGYSDWNWTKN